MAAISKKVKSGRGLGNNFFFSSMAKKKSGEKIEKIKQQKEKRQQKRDNYKEMIYVCIDVWAIQTIRVCMCMCVCF